MRPTRKATVLVADDEPGLVRLIQFNLQMEGYEVLEARNGEEALEKAREHRPDLIILDVMMPKLDGLEVLVQLKEDERTRNVPVVMLTAVDVPEKAWKRGVDFYLNKPFDPAQLLEIVHRLLHPDGID